MPYYEVHTQGQRLLVAHSGRDLHEVREELVRTRYLLGTMITDEGEEVDVLLAAAAIKSIACARSD